MKKLSHLYRLIILMISALGLTLAFAPFPFRFLAFCTLIPLFSILSSSPRPFLYGWLFGFFAGMFHLWWLWFLLVPVEPITRILLNIGVVLLFGYLGLYWGLFALGIKKLGYWTAPLLIPLLEFIKTRTQLAFPWDLLGYTMTPLPVFTQLAAIGGVYLISSWLVLINLLLYLLIAGRRRLHHTLALIIAVLTPLLFGILRIKTNTPWFDVAILQPNVSPLDKGDWNSKERIQRELIQLTLQAAGKKPRMVIFPETATLVDVTHSTDMGPALQRLSDSLEIEIFTGTPIYDDQHRTYHNGAVLIEPHAEKIVQRYYKLRLVPFSEKIPYSDELPIIRRLIGTADMGNWDRGWSYTVFQSRTGKFSGMICYEAIFADLAREFVRRGAQMLVVVTNDGWFGKLPGAYQHAELAVLRTVELGVPMLRSANNGISFIADPYGRILKKTRLFEQTVLFGTAPRPLKTTIYRKFGDWLILIYPLLIIAGFAARRRSIST